MISEGTKSQVGSQVVLRKHEGTRATTKVMVKVLIMIRLVGLKKGIKAGLTQVIVGRNQATQPVVEMSGRYLV
jgi:hypothetical protein